MDASLGVAAALTATLLWAWSGVRFMPIIRGHGPFVVATFKAGTAALLFWAVLLLWPSGAPAGAFGAPRLPDASAVRALIASGIAGIAIGDYAYFASMRRAGVRHAALIYSAAPLFLLVYQGLHAGRATTAGQVAGVLAIVLGVGVVTWDRTSGGASGRGDLAAGTLWALLAALGQAAGIVLQKEALAHADVVPAAAWRLTGATAGLLVILLLRGRAGAFLRTVSRREVWREALLPVFFGTFVGIGCMTLVVQKTSEAVAGALLSLTPVFVLPVSWIMVRERVSPAAALGTLVAVGGIVLLHF